VRARSVLSRRGITRTFEPATRDTLPYCEQECSRECSTLARRAELVRTHYAGRLCPSPAVAARARANSNECESVTPTRGMSSHSEEARARYELRRDRSDGTRTARTEVTYAPRGRPLARLPIESSNTRRGCVRRDEGEYQRGVPGGACGDSATASARTARGVVRARGFASEGDTHGIHGERRRHRRSRGNVDHFGGRPRADGAADGSPPLVTTGPTVSLKELPPRLSCAGGAPPVCPTGHHGLRDCHRGAFE